MTTIPLVLVDESLLLEVFKDMGEILRLIGYIPQSVGLLKELSIHMAAQVSSR